MSREIIVALYEALNEDRLKSILKEFECELNKDVEYFIREKAIEFLKSKKRDGSKISYEKHRKLVPFLFLQSRSSF